MLLQKSLLNDIMKILVKPKFWFFSTFVPKQRQTAHMCGAKCKKTNIYWTTCLNRAYALFAICFDGCRIWLFSFSKAKNFQKGCMKLKAKRILSLVLSAAMLLSLFCILPSVTASAEGETMLYGDTHGVLTNYSISSNEKTQDGTHQKIGGISETVNEQMQTYASMVANGFTDTKFPSYVTFRVKAAAAGTYTIKARAQLGGNVGAGYFMVLDVNDKRFYKQEVSTSGYSDVAFEAVLDEGINIIRVFTRLGETMELVKTGAWVNFDGIIIPSTLTGVEKGTAATFNAQQAQYYKYNTSGSVNLGDAGEHLSTLCDRQFTYDTMKIGNVYQVPYLSYTVVAEESGYYDMGFSMNTAGNGEGYMVAFVDAQKYKIYYKNVEGWSTKNVSLYIPAGTHNITFTNVWEYTGGGKQGAHGYTDWCDFGQLFVRSGNLKLAAEGIDPKTIGDPTRLEAETMGDTFKFGEPTQANNTGSGGAVAGNIGFDYSKGQTLESLGTYFDKSNMAYVTFVVKAPADGTYTITPGYNLSTGSTSHKLAVLVNKDDVYAVPFSKMGTSYFNATSVDVKLTKGTNIIRLIPFTLDNNLASGVWMNVDYLDIDPLLTGLKADDYEIFEAEDALAENIVRFGNPNDSATIDDRTVVYVSGADISSLTNSNVTTANFNSGYLALMPYVAITVTAPEDGWYDITGSINSPDFKADPYFAPMVIDGKSYIYGYRKSTANKAFMGDSKTADRSAADYTAYLTKGDHVLAFATSIPADSTGSYQWMDFDYFRLGGGLTKAAVQKEFSIKLANSDVESAAHLNFYQKTYNSSKDSGFENEGYYPNYTAGTPSKNGSGTFEQMGQFLDNSSTPYVAYAINAPKAGTYGIRIRFRFGCSGGDTVAAATLQSYYETTGEYPYATAVVNNGDNFKLNYSAKSNGSLQNGWWVTASIAANLNEGTNVLYLMGPTSEMRSQINGAYVDYGAVSLDSELSMANADLVTLGDAGGDGVVSIKDILRIKKYLANNGTEISFSQADFDGNNVINASDLSTMVKMIIAPETVGNLTWLQVKNRTATGYTVTRSNPDSNTWLVSDSASVKRSRTSGKINIDVSTGTTYQTVDGFGASLTDSTAQNMALLTKDQLNEVINDLFSTTQGDALGLTFLRQPVGASDFASPLYTYDDMAQGQTDTSLNNFSIAHDTNPVVSSNKLEAYGNVENGYSMVQMLQMAKAASGNNITFFATPWTAPLWMKTYYRWNTIDDNGDVLSNTLNTNYYGTYANYLVKFLKAYADNGIDFSYMSPQNEPSARHGITSMYMSATHMSNFVRNSLSGAVNSYNSTYGKSVKLVGFDFNTHHGYTQFITDTMMNYYTGGVAFHAYSNAYYDELVTVYNKYGKKVFITEAAGNTSLNSYKGDGTYSTTYFNYPRNFFCNTNRTTAALLNRANVFSYWNIMLDEQIGPTDKSGQEGNTWGIGLMGYNRLSGEYYKTEDYYALAHYSKFIRKGAVIVGSTSTTSEEDYSGFNNVVARNTDGSYAMVLNNDTGFEKSVSINTGLGYYIEYTVPARSTVSLTWTASGLAAYAS